MAAKKRTARRSLPHLTQKGDVHMVDVGVKAATKRRAQAEAIITLSPKAIRALKNDSLKKGDALATSKIAAITGAKQTPQLIPLCHPLALTHVSVDLRIARTHVALVVTTETTGPTGVEMEAMVGASAGALALYDMVKSLDRGATFHVALLEKSGGKSGPWVRKS